MLAQSFKIAVVFCFFYAITALVIDELEVLAFAVERRGLGRISPVEISLYRLIDIAYVSLLKAGPRLSSLLHDVVDDFAGNFLTAFLAFEFYFVELGNLTHGSFAGLGSGGSQLAVAAI